MELTYLLILAALIIPALVLMVEAIKLIRERTGLGLKEAKELVDRLG